MIDSKRLIKQWNNANESLRLGEVEAALFTFKKLDKEGFELAAYEIGNIYEHGGGGVTKNYLKAIKWYEKSVTRSNDELSRFGLARIYFETRKVGENGRKAFEHFYYLRNSNQPGALYALGILTESGIGTQKNKLKAISYFENAARYGHLLALNRYGLLLLKQGKIFKGLTLMLKARFRAYRVYKENNYTRDWRFGIKKVVDSDSLTINIKI